MIIRDVWNWLTGNGAGDYREGRDRVWRWEPNWRINPWWAYLAIAVYTFGYSASTYPAVADPENYYTENEALGATALKALVGGAAWPLYWTWEIMD